MSDDMPNTIAPDPQTSQMDEEELELLKMAMLEQLHNQYNDELERMYLEFVDKLEEIKAKYQQNTTGSISPQVTQQVPDGQVNNIVSGITSLQ